LKKMSVLLETEKILKTKLFVVCQGGRCDTSGHLAVAIPQYLTDRSFL
jgi:hypothetical protein